MKIALYARVSKALDQNPENQLLELRRWAQVMDHEVIGEYIDEISSKDTRPRKEEILKLIRQAKIGGVAFWSLDRWGRTMSELVLEIEEFSKNHWLMFSFKEALDLTTAAGRAFAYNMASFANFERDRIRERTLLGLARATAHGKIKGRHPINCGCGIKGHNGNIKPIRDQSNIKIGWKQTPPEIIKENHTKKLD